ncbi:precorrin-8X methylmutase [Neptunomonas marina]|uniref:Precorrin-8X methylmutase n=1 Tax=Neptunomonas marina TaxID=1815562 RepID=A0A437Q469_9GAMM|nr:precorrin-8X methylmutase [Neptunomonas marina]RVU29304.1 precorrin-8X methylmutase [Neptunomonas marina]
MSAASPQEYIADPSHIEARSFELIRQEAQLDHLSRYEQQVAMRVIHSLGMPELAQHLRFSGTACAAGMQALTAQAPILCDAEMVKEGVTKRMISEAPLCFLNHPETPKLAAQHGETRSMAALRQWEPHLEGAVVLIGNAPTALFRLIEMLHGGAAKPALIIGMPVGFVGAAESKQLLWEQHQALGVPCITLLGRIGGSAVTAASCNALLRCIRGELY